MLPQIKSHFLPEDGAWHRAAWWREVSAECAERDVVEAAEAALLAVFSPDWGRALATDDADTHPFEWHFQDRGGVGRLVKLGYSLSLLGSPRQLVSDLVEPTRFESRTSEAWAGAFVQSLGAQVEYIEERTHGGEGAEPGPSHPVPEFIATLDGSRFGVEVKHLDMGDAERRHIRVEQAFNHAILVGEVQAGTQRLGAVGSRARRTFPPEILAALENEEFERALALAEERGREIGRAYVEFVASRPAPGYWSVIPGLSVWIGPEYSGEEGSFPFPGLPSYFGRIRRNILRASVKKFRACKVPGFIVLFRPWWPVWPPQLIDAVQNILRRTVRQDCVAAVAFVDEVPEPGMRWLKDRVEVVTGPGWEALPEVIREHFRPCESCGRRHRVFELLRQSSL